MLDVLRDLFLRAIECKTCSEANRLVDLWNEEIESINKRFNLYYTGKQEVVVPISGFAPVVHAHWRKSGDIYICSGEKGCGFWMPEEQWYNAHFACPACGAKMDEE